MSLTVERGDPRDPAAMALLRQSHALMESLFPPEDNFFLDIDALTAPHIAFFVALNEGQTLGTAALADKGAYGEVKSMFVSEAARGLGVGAALMARLEREARDRLLPTMMLETGNVLYAAHRLYARAGFTKRGPFGDYPAAASSIFMEKRLG
ncbi:GNAT family N-acetyltransferase [Sinisalibacter aestuarii]|uniref:N-acetyltransferase n=1 Tax=Sinisalibacter aestuarii TaxID=2949426 RepID=A0ABQ5LPM2_9RHOB|nr:GNAT family N-acetyltransferase [Sinisalibacter aestuarii]GKY86911.1 N-acetyltransferase [Sinisalibacter aestuarii]